MLAHVWCTAQPLGETGATVLKNVEVVSKNEFTTPPQPRCGVVFCICLPACLPACLLVCLVASLRGCCGQLRRAMSTDIGPTGCVSCVFVRHYFPTQSCADQTRVSASRSCNIQYCWKAWHVVASACVTLSAVVCGHTCRCMYEKCGEKLAKPVEQPTEGYVRCGALSEEDQRATLRISGSEHATRDSLAHGDLRFSIHDRPDDSYTSLSPIGVQEISPPTKEELDLQIFARANRNPVSIC